MCILVCIFGEIGYLWPVFCTSQKLMLFVLFLTCLSSKLITLWTRTRFWSIQGERGEEKSLFSVSPFTFFNDKIYLGYSAAIPWKLLDHLGSWPPQRQPWCSQKTSIQKLQTGFDENNWPHLSLSPTQHLHQRLQHRHLRLKTKVLRFNNLIQEQSLTKL